MNLRDPARPRNAIGYPLLTFASVIVPPLHLTCREAGGWYISIDVPTATNQFSQRTHIYTDDELLLFLHAYTDNPEQVLFTDYEMPRELKEVLFVAPEKTQSLLKHLAPKAPEAPKDMEF